MTNFLKTWIDQIYTYKFFHRDHRFNPLGTLNWILINFFFFKPSMPNVNQYIKCRWLYFSSFINTNSSIEMRSVMKSGTRSFWFCNPTTRHSIDDRCARNHESDDFFSAVGRCACGIAILVHRRTSFLTKFGVPVERCRVFHPCR